VRNRLVPGGKGVPTAGEGELNTRHQRGKAISSNIKGGGGASGLCSEKTPWPEGEGGGER